MDKPKYTTIFATNPIKCVIGEEKDKFLSLASLENLKAFIPAIDIQKEIDILPIAFDACVVNRINKNGDIIDTSTAVDIYKRFINRFIDTEHNRTKIVGVITSASFSEFGSNRLLSEEDVKGKDFPFNITLGGVIWKAINSDLCDLIEDSNDPTSENYKQVSASWELGFSNFKIVELAQGEKNLVNPIEVTDEAEKESIKKYLKCFGGSGVKDGKSYYRMPSENVVPMGIGLTEKPAADVLGVATIVKQNQDNLPMVGALSESVGEIPLIKVTATENSVINISAESKNNFAQAEKVCVKEEGLKTNMKLNSISDLNDETLKQCTASVITQFISDEIKKGSEQFVKASTEEKNQVAELSKKNNDILASFTDLQKTVANLQKERDERQGIDLFNFRMNELHASYDLPADVAAVVASDVKALTSDDSYASYKTKAAIMLKPFGKDAKMHGLKQEHDKAVDGKGNPFQKKGETEVGADSQKGIIPKQANAEEEAAAMNDGPKDDNKDENDKKKKSTKSGPEDDKENEKKAKAAIASAVEDAIDNSSKEKGGLPNGTSAASKTVKDKYAQAFAVENFIVK